ncbi:hypothetical protein AURDEDRAFT_177726 [Auricularia subglabra TFB-10046 SS5]|uniref:Uncharacterized protein n=1 Tax=Auricularia subglabra (strain TFB-10046 / SS5) TaxID=717982 RepID=J0WMY2_AURST|nr:hypothetical protein AURDEDRAFT_177726 [Auricularia subglabra TFB-10046 SS5]
MLLALSLQYEAPWYVAIQDPLPLISTTERLRRPTALPLTAITRDADGRPADREHPQTVRLRVPPSAARLHRCRAKRGAAVPVTLLDVFKHAARCMHAHGPRAVREVLTMVSLDTLIAPSAPPRRRRRVLALSQGLGLLGALGAQPITFSLTRITASFVCDAEERRSAGPVIGLDGTGASSSSLALGGSGEASSFVDRAPEPRADSTLESDAPWMPAHLKDRSRRPRANFTNGPAGPSSNIGHGQSTLPDTRVSFMNGTGEQVKGNR